MIDGGRILSFGGSGRRSKPMNHQQWIGKERIDASLGSGLSRHPIPDLAGCLGSYHSLPNRQMHLVSLFLYLAWHAIPRAVVDAR